MGRQVNRRQFVVATTAVSVGMALNNSGLAGPGQVASAQTVSKPALLGGKPARSGGYASWPIVTSADEKSVLEAVHSGHWNRGRSVDQFEMAFARMHGAKHCIAVSSGTSALYTSLGALMVGPGDEVIVPPYTFLATVNVAMLHYAMPVFVDSDRETFLMDPAKLEAAITERTAAIVPVHIGGSAANMDQILAIAKKHNVPVIEDACQAVLGRWRDRGVGAWGTSGCFSFQVSKNVCCGEGGAILTNDDAMADNCYAFHNCGRKPPRAGPDFNYRGGRCTNARMTEFQGALLLTQLEAAEQRAKTRSENAAYLTSMLREIPGIVPARIYEGCTRNACHIYMFRYQPEMFAGLPRLRFLKALHAEGIPCSAGYSPLNKEAFISDALNTRPYIKVYGKAAIDNWADRNHCPENDKLCEEAAWFMQNIFLGPRSDMDAIAEAIRRIQAHAGELAKA